MFSLLIALKFNTPRTMLCKFCIGIVVRVICSIFRTSPEAPFSPVMEEMVVAVFSSTFFCFVLCVVTDLLWSYLYMFGGQANHTVYHVFISLQSGRLQVLGGASRQLALDRPPTVG